MYKKNISRYKYFDHKLLIQCNLLLYQVLQCTRYLFMFIFYVNWYLHDCSSIDLVNLKCTRELINCNVMHEHVIANYFHKQRTWTINYYIYLHQVLLPTRLELFGSDWLATTIGLKNLLEHCCSSKSLPKTVKIRECASVCNSESKR